MKINVYTFRFDDENISYKISPKGYILKDNFDLNELFSLCNWREKSTIMPSEMANCSVSTTGTGIIFENPLDKLFYIYLPRGWKKYESIKDFELDLHNHINENLKLCKYEFAFFSIKENLIEMGETK